MTNYINFIDTPCVASVQFWLKLTGLALGVSCLSAQAMQIAITEPGEGAKFLHMDKYTVQLSGPIENGDASRLEAKLKLLQAPERTFSFYLHSPGGNLMEGMKLGRIIRKYGLTTYVGQYRGESEKSLPGHCYSACSLSFLGGSYRYVDEGSKYGVHRFYSNGAASPEDMDTAQIVSAAVANYIREMDVDLGLINKMTAAGKDEMNVLSDKDLKDLNVINGGRLPANWTIEVVKGSTFLRGEQTTVWGRGRSMFVCGTKGAVMQSIAPVGDKAQSMVEGKWVHSILVNGKTVPISNPVGMRADDGYLISLIPLSVAQVRTLAKAKTIGQAIQMSRDDPRFVGYYIDIDKQDQERVETYLTNCIAAK